MIRRNLVRALWVAALVAVLLLCVRAFVGDVRRVESSSMEPTLAQGEWTFVSLGVETPTRGQLVVARPPRGDMPVVKRLSGLPGESVRLVQGDVWVNGAPPEVALDAFPWILHSDSERHAVRDSWSADATWTDLPHGVRGDMRSTPLRLLSVDDGWWTAQGERVDGPHAVADIKLDVTVKWTGHPAQLIVTLHQRGEAIELRIERMADSVALALLNGPSDAPEVARTGLAYANITELPQPEHGLEQTWTVLARDGWAYVLYNGAAFMSAPLPKQRLHKGDTLQEGRSYPPRAIVRFGAGGGDLLRLALWRDLYWQPVGAYAVERPLDLGPDQCFLLGDASFQSRDSREWGPVPVADLLGRPVAVVWPPSAWRWLP